MLENLSMRVFRSEPELIFVGNGCISSIVSSVLTEVKTNSLPKKMQNIGRCSHCFSIQFANLYDDTGQQIEVTPT